MTKEFTHTAKQLIQAGHALYQRGWVPATSGNFSARLSDGTIAITVSGKHKGQLGEEDIMLVDTQGNSLDGKKPSAETRLHTHIYSRFMDIHAVLHPHSANAALISRLLDDHVILEDYELLKAFNGIDTHECRVNVPIFANDQDIARLAAEVDTYMNSHDPIYGYLINGHGFYTWGTSIDEALRHVEAFEFLFECEMKLLGVHRL